MRNFPSVFISAEDDQLALAEELSKIYGGLDLTGVWNEIVLDNPVDEFLTRLPSAAPGVNWKERRETVESYLKDHFFYALLNDEREVAMSRYIISRFVKNLPFGLFRKAIDHIERAAMQEWRCLKP